MWQVLNGVQKLLARLTATRAGYLDASISSRASQTSLNTVDTNVDTLVARLTSGRASNLDLIDNIWNQFPIAAVDWSAKTPKVAVAGDIPAGETIIVCNISGSGYLTGFSHTQDGSYYYREYRVTIDGTVLVGWSDIDADLTINLTGIMRFNNSLLVEIRNSSGYTAAGDTLVSYVLD